MLQDFFGQAKSGADARAANFQVPSGLSQQTLQAYQELAERALAAGNDSTGVQAARLDLVQQALNTFSQE